SYPNYGKDLTEVELWTYANMMIASINPSLKANIFNTNNIFDSDESYILCQNTLFSVFNSVNSNTFIASETKLNIEDIADLTLPLFNFNNTELYYENLKLQSKLASSKGHRNINFEASNIVDE
ncbi:368_t:CDS:1, partial [Scutellospora calospora]